MDNNSSYGKALIAGLAGSAALTGAHELLRKTDTDAPRMDLLGMQSLSRLLRFVGAPIPGQPVLFGWTMLGDIGTNTLYYSLAAKGNSKNVWLKGTVLGLSAGLGAVLLPKPMNLDSSASTKTSYTTMATIAIYLIGGLVTAAVASAMSRSGGPSKT